MTDEDKTNLRNGIEWAIRMVSCADRTDAWADVRGGMDEQYMHLDVFKRDESVTPEPLPTHRQLALSVLLGEDVPLAVLIQACEDAGVFAGGVLEAIRAGERERCAKMCEAFSSDAVVAWPDGGSYDNIEAGHRIAAAIRGSDDPEIDFNTETETVFVNGTAFSP